MNVKPAAAFAVGLWIGAVVVVAVGAFNWRVWQGMRREGELHTPTELADKDREIQQLLQERARLTAEAQRLAQTVAELKSGLETRTAQEARREVRRVPFRRPGAEESSDAWIAQAVANGDTEALPRLEELANQNDETALEALALLADRDGGAALTRVWNSPSLSFANKLKATRYLAATLEANPRAAELLQSLFNSPTTDVRLLYAAVDGIADPGVQSPLRSLSGPPSARPPAPAFDVRVQLLDALTPSITDAHLRSHVESARDALLTRWVQAEPTVQ